MSGKFRIPEMMLGALLAVAIFGIGMLFVSWPHQPVFWNWITHDAAGFFTLWLVIVGGFQIGLFVWQLRLIRESLHDAKTAADAAHQAAEAGTRQARIAEESFAKLERPYVFIFGVRKFETERTRLVPFVRYSVANYGKTPAIIMHAAAGISMGSGPDLPLRVDDTHQLFTARVVATGYEYHPDVEAPDGIEFRIIGEAGREEVVPQLTGQDDIFVWIVITYRGPFTDHHETSACWRYDGLTNRLIQHGGGDYNYEK